MTRRSKWYHQDYFNYCKEILAAFNRAGKFLCAEKLHWTAYFATDKPERWGKPHRHKPDIDNITKSILDSLFLKDERIFGGSQLKVWSDVNMIEIVIEGVEYA